MRILVKDLCVKSKWGHNVSGQVKALLDEEISRVIERLGRIVGSRSLQKFKDALKIYRIKDRVFCINFFLKEVLFLLDISFFRFSRFLSSWTVSRRTA